MIECVPTRYGPIYIPDTDNGQYWWLKTAACSPEDEYIDLVCALLDERPPGLAIDAGANFGCWSLPLTQHALQVWAFEPQRCVLDVLKKTIAANVGNGARNIELFPFALGAAAGWTDVPDIQLDDSTNFGGVAMGKPHPEHPDAPMYRVPVVALDSMTLPNMPVAFIKADVEGGEMGLLEGAKRVIERHKPVLFIEADHPDTDTQALGRCIEALGYNVEVQGNNFLGMPV